MSTLAPPRLVTPIDISPWIIFRFYSQIVVTSSLLRASYRVEYFSLTFIFQLSLSTLDVGSVSLGILSHTSVSGSFQGTRMLLTEASR